MCVCVWGEHTEGFRFNFLDFFPPSLYYQSATLTGHHHLQYNIDSHTLSDLYLFQIVLSYFIRFQNVSASKYLYVLVRCTCDKAILRHRYSSLPLGRAEERGSKSEPGSRTLHDEKLLLRTFLIPPLPPARSLWHAQHLEQRCSVPLPLPGKLAKFWQRRNGRDKFKCLKFRVRLSCVVVTIPRQSVRNTSKRCRRYCCGKVDSL